MFRIDLEGGEELVRQLETLPIKVAGSAIRSALKDAMKPILAACKTNIHSVTGRLVASLKLKSRTNTRKGTASAEVVTSSDKFGQGNQFYAAFAELGHLSGKKKSANRKPVPPTFAMRDAFDDNRESSIVIFQTRLQQRIDKALGGSK